MGNVGKVRSTLPIKVAKPPRYKNMNTGREKTHVFILLLATVFVTVCKFITKRSSSVYKDLKYRNLFLKTHKIYTRHKMLLILPKIFLFTCYLLTSCKSSKNEPPTSTDLQTNGTKELFSYEYFAFSNNPCLIESNMSLYALSKLKLRNHRSFFRSVLSK